MCAPSRRNGGGRDNPSTCSVAAATARNVNGVPIGATGWARCNVTRLLSPRIAAMPSTTLGGEMDNQKVFAMKLSRVYPLLVQKAERKGRTKDEVNQVICWLCGYDEAGIRAQLERDVDYKTFFDEAPRMNPLASRVTGKVCGVRVEDIEDPTMRAIRQLDKLVDELAKGRTMERILRR